MGVVDSIGHRKPHVSAVWQNSLEVLFGKKALTGSESRTATVRAGTPCTCWVPQRQATLSPGEQSQRLGWLTLLETACLLGQRLTRTDQDVLRLSEAVVMEVENEGQTR